VNCGSCGHSARAGTCRLAFVFDSEGAGLVRRRICASCIKHAVLIVSPASGVGPAQLLTPNEVETRHVLRALARYLRRLAKAYRSVLPGQLTIERDLAPEGYRVAGLEAAADVADGWAAAPQVRQLDDESPRMSSESVDAAVVDGIMGRGAEAPGKR